MKVNPRLKHLVGVFAAVTSLLMGVPSFAMTDVLSPQDVTTQGALGRTALDRPRVQVPAPAKQPLAAPTSLQIIFPGISLALAKVATPAPGYSATLADAQKPLTIGALIINQGTIFVSQDSKQVVVSGQGTLLGKPVTISAKNFVFDPKTKDMTELTLTLAFDKDSKKRPGITFMGQTVTFDSASVTLKKKEKAAIVAVTGTLFGKPHTFIIVVSAEALSFTTQLPSANLGQLVPAFKVTPLAGVNLSILNLTVGNLFPKTERAKKYGPSFSMFGGANLSALKMPSVSSTNINNAPTAISFSKSTGFKFNADLAGVKIPFIDVLKNVKISTTFKEGQASALKLLGDANINFPGIGKLDLSLNSSFGKDGISFGAIPKLPQLKYGHFTISKPTIVFSAADKTVTISGNVAGAAIKLIKDAAGKIRIIGPGIPTTGLSLDVPVLGKLSLKDVAKPVPGFSVDLASMAKPLNLGPLRLNVGSLFVSKDYKTVSLTGQGKLFGKNVKVGVKEAVFSKDNKMLDKLVFNITLGADKPSFSFMGKTISLDSGTLLFVVGKELGFSLVANLFGKQVSFAVVQGKESTKLSTTLPTMGIGDLFPRLKTTPLGKINLSGANLSLDGLFPKTESAKSKGISFSLTGGKSDLSGMNMSGASSTQSKAAPTSISFGKLTGFDLNISLPEFKLPAFVDKVIPVQNARIATAYKEGEKARIVLGGDLALNFPGIGTDGKIDVALASSVGSTGIEFEGSLKKPLSYQQFTLKKGTVYFSTKNKTIRISGMATSKEKGVQTKAEIVIVKSPAGIKLDRAVGEMKIEVPAIGVVTLNIDPQKGYSAEFASPDKPLVLGALTLTSATLFMTADAKKTLSLTGSGILFGKAITAGITKFEWAEVGKNVKTIELGLGFDAKDRPTLNFVPGKSIAFTSASVSVDVTTFAQKKEVTLSATGNLFGKDVTFTITVGPSSTKISGTMPTIKIPDLIPALKGGPFDAVGIGGTLTLDNLFPKKEEDKAKGSSVSLTGNTDLSSVKMSGSSRKGGFTGLPMSLNFSKAAGFNFNVNLPDFQMPDFFGKVPLRDAKLGFDGGGTTGKPLAIVLSGGLSMPFPTIPKPLDIDLSAKFTKTGIDFKGNLKRGITIGKITLPKVGIEFSTEKKTVTISGDTTIFGYKTNARFTKGPDGKLTGSASIPDKKIQPFAKLKIPGLKDFAIENPQFEFTQGEGDKLDIALAGAADFFGLMDLKGRMEYGKEGDEGSLFVDVTLPGAFSIGQIIPRLKDSPFDWVKFSSPHAILTTAKKEDKQTGITYEPGVNVQGTFNLNSGAFAPLALFTKNPSLTLGGHLNTQAPMASSLFANLPTGVKIPGNVLRLGPLGFEIAGGEDVTFGLVGLAYIKPSEKDQELRVKAKIKVSVSSQVFVEGEIDNWHNPLGMKFDLKQVYLKLGVGIPELIPEAVGVAGDFVFGQGKNAKEVKVKGNVEAHNPFATELSGELQGRLCISDIVSLATNMAKTAGKSGPKTDKIPNMCIKDVAVKLKSPRLTEMRGILNILNQQACLRFRASPLEGILAQGMLSPVRIMAGDLELLSIKAAPQEKGAVYDTDLPCIPTTAALHTKYEKMTSAQLRNAFKDYATIDMRLSPTQMPLFRISGKIGIINGAIVASTYMSISKDGMFVTLNGNMGAFEGTFLVSAPLNFNNPQFRVKAELKNFLGPKISQAVTAEIKKWKEQSNKALEKAHSDCSEAMKKGACKKSKCGVVEASEKVKSDCAKSCDRHCPKSGIARDCPFAMSACYGACSLSGWITKTFTKTVCDVRKFGCNVYDVTTQGLCDVVKGAEAVNTAVLDFASQATAGTIDPLKIDSIGFDVDLAKLAQLIEGKIKGGLDLWFKGKIGQLKLDLDTRNIDPRNIGKMIEAIAKKILQDVKKAIDPKGVILK